MYDQIVFQSDNTLGIPTLRLDMQANYLVKPTMCWGSRSRDTENTGTTHFYTDDYRWNTLLKNPDKLVKTKPSVCAELNITMFEDTPPALCVAEIFKKRWVSRYLQEKGIKILVDLFVPQKLKDYNLLGVPSGWKAFCTRGSSKNIEGLQEDYKTACSYAKGSYTDSYTNDSYTQNNVLFVVFCGGSTVADWCNEHNAIHVPYKAKKNAHSA